MTFCPAVDATAISKRILKTASVSITSDISASPFAPQGGLSVAHYAIGLSATGVVVLSHERFRSSLRMTRPHERAGPMPFVPSIAITDARCEIAAVVISTARSVENQRSARIRLSGAEVRHQNALGAALTGAKLRLHRGVSIATKSVSFVTDFMS